MRYAGENHTILEKSQEGCVCMPPHAPERYAADATSGCAAVESISRPSPSPPLSSHTLWAARNISGGVTSAPHGPQIAAWAVATWNPRALKVAQGPLRAHKSVFLPPPSEGPPVPGKTNLAPPRAASQRSHHQSSARFAARFVPRLAVRPQFLLSTVKSMVVEGAEPCPN
jgi:hypothetical protein